MLIMQGMKFSSFRKLLVPYRGFYYHQAKFDIEVYHVEVSLVTSHGDNKNEIDDVLSGILVYACTCMYLIGKEQKYMLYVCKKAIKQEGRKDKVCKGMSNQAGKCTVQV